MESRNLVLSARGYAYICSQAAEGSVFKNAVITQLRSEDYYKVSKLKHDNSDP